MKSFLNQMLKKINIQEERGNPVRKSSAVGVLISYHTLGQPVWTPRRYEQLTQEGYKRNVIVYRAVNLIARGVASVPWRLYEGKQEITVHPLLDLLHSPSKRQAGSAFMEAVAAYLLLSGNAYVEAVHGGDNTLLELHLLRPDRVRVIPGKQGNVQGYEYTVNGQSKILPQQGGKGQKRILHLKTFHPLNDWYGLSPLEAAACAIDQHNTVAGHNLALLQNGGRPSGALMVGASGKEANPLSQEQREELKESVKELCEGENNAGRVLVLEGDFQWKEMGLSPRDLDFIEGKKLSAREISQAYGVPPMLVGVPGDATFSNYREARYHLWEDTILPLLDHIIDEFNAWLIPQFEGELRLSYNIDGIPALAPRREETWTKFSHASFLTINEKRRAMGYPPLKDGDRL